MPERTCRNCEYRNRCSESKYVPVDDDERDEGCEDWEPVRKRPAPGKEAT